MTKDEANEGMLLHQRVALARRQGKSKAMHYWIEHAFQRHKTVLVMTNDQKGTIKQLRRWFPTNLMELCDSGVRIYRK